MRLRGSALWQAGLDYDHGTGHGVGSYLSVHEGPASISRAAKPVALLPGMILSNEPGYYLPGAYGIRMENLVLVREAEFPAQKRKFLRFETLTLAPFDRALIDPSFAEPLGAGVVERLSCTGARGVDAVAGRCAGGACVAVLRNCKNINIDQPEADIAKFVIAIRSDWPFRRFFLSTSQRWPDHAPVRSPRPPLGSQRRALAIFPVIFLGRVGFRRIISI